MCWVPSHVLVQLYKRVNEAAKNEIENQATDLLRTDLQVQVKESANLIMGGMRCRKLKAKPSSKLLNNTFF